MEDQPINTQAQQDLPNSVTVLVLGILSIVVCWCYGIPGIVLGIIALIMAKKANTLYLNSPNTYSETSYKNMRAGRICAIVGLCISAVYIVFIIIYIAIIGVAIGGGLLQGLGDF